MAFSAALKAGVAAFALVTALAAPAFALAPPPVQGEKAAAKPAIDLMAHSLRGDRTANLASLRISRMDADVVVVGNVAQTTLTLTFANPTGEQLEGDFSLQLPIGAYVTGYALDVNGRMIDGVLQSKLQAREAYEEKLREGVDPGLAEVDDRNLFRTRVFPILPDSGRTIRVIYITPIVSGGVYSLPLATANAVGEATVKVSVPSQFAAQPVLSAGVLREAGATIQDGIRTVTYAARDVVLTGELSVRAGDTGAPLVTRHKNGEAFFNVVVEAAPAGTQKVKSLRVYWDASRSRRDDDTAAEAQLVADYVDAVKPLSLDLILFADGAPKIVHFAMPGRDAVLKVLKDIDYSGATRFTALDRVLPGKADVCLLVSDGRMTFDAFEVGKWPCRVLSLTSSKAARRDVLSQLSARNRGVLVDLSTVNHEEALTRLRVRPAKLWDIEDSSGRSIDYAVTPIGQDRYRVFGPRPANGGIRLIYDDATLDYDLDRALTIAHDGVGALWGATRIDRLNAIDAPDRAKVLETARHYSVATPDVSFIVLETGTDYAKAGIAPPDAAGKAILADYLRTRDQLAAKAKADKTERFGDILQRWNGQKDWYAGKYMSLKEASGTIAKDMQVMANRRARAAPPADAPVPAYEMSAPPPPPAVQARITPNAVVREDLGALPDTNLTEALQRVSGITISRFSAQGGAASGIEISSAEWNPDRPYLKALDAAPAADVEAVYRAQEKQHGDTPAFYFDVAEWTFRKGDAAGAAAIARTALDVSAADHDTRIILAGRLLRYGAYDDAIWLYEHILSVTPEKPQATRNLALALIDATEAGLTAGKVSKTDAVARYERALDQLMKVVLTPWDDDYDGIELISLMEANRLAARLKTMGVGQGELSERIDPRLVAMMDVDIRITLEWNTDKTDMDLWVDEPSKERVIFNRPKSLMGGRLSNDMTEGYGPEEYLLRTAPTGEYNVLADVYAADVLNRNGATSVTVRLYRDWGRPTEKMESFVIELQKGEEGAKTVGTFVRK